MRYCFTIGKTRVTIDAATLAEARERLARIKRDYRGELRGRTKFVGEFAK